MRLNLSMGQKTRDRLTALKVNTEASSDAEVIRHALAVYELLTKEKMKGSTVFVRDHDGAEREVFLVP